MSKLASTLREKRKSSGLSVAEVLEKLNTAGISISDKTLYNWETGSRKPNADEFFQLCLIYGVKSFSEFKEETKKSPAPEGTEDKKPVVSLEQSTRFLVAMGLIREGEQLSDRDVEFLEHLVGLLRAWFAEHKAKNR